MHLKENFTLKFMLHVNMHLKFHGYFCLKYKQTEDEYKTK